ncbi:hypothetical protein LNKW23_26260 [Paralimibaculum aggregatum]|uniref:Spondin domain-containing protein n=1 Tax=Paralimibaculum aggregatum TaxID=3036245 RepID=A0ABQ6LPV1_9RHOB|nr:hypothetical protein LNKW23_26260 [Limibaculum sp. NKW23]
MRYRLDVAVTGFDLAADPPPPNDAHFSHIGGATHTGAMDFWEVGGLLTPGLIRMAEIGSVDQFVAEDVAAAVTAGTAGAPIAFEQWFCPGFVSDARCGGLTVYIDMDEAFPLLTLVSMIGPSPDWFVGVDGLEMHDGTDWVDHLVVELQTYDGGTRSGNAWAIGGPQNDPQAAVTLITDATGQLVGGDPVGSFTFTRVDVPLPAAGWLLLAGLAGLGLRARRG